MSPDAKHFAYGHGLPSDEGCCGIFSSALNTIAIGNTDNLAVSDVGEKGKHAKWHLTWSPDSKFLAYVVNDGEGFQIMDTSNGKIIAESQGKETSPVVWLSNDSFSFIQDKKLYNGTTKNTKETTIAENTDNRLCNFEGPEQIAPPTWSKDGAWVAFYTKEAYVILNKTNGTKHTAKIINAIAKDEICSDHLDIDPIGFESNNNFYYLTSSNTQTYSIDAATGKSAAFENLYAGPGMILNNISPSMSRFTYHSEDAKNYSINEPTANGNRICNGKFYHLDDLAGYGKANWSNKYPNVVAVVNHLIQGDTISLLDTKNCQIITKTTINDQTDQYSDNFLGIE